MKKSKLLFSLSLGVGIIATPTVIACNSSDAKNEKLNNELLILKAENALLEKQLNNKEKEINSKNDDLITLKINKESLTKQLENLQNEHKAKLSELEITNNEKIKEAEDKIEKIKAEKENLKQELQSANNEKAELSKKVKETEDKIEVIKAEKENLKQELEAKKEELNNLKKNEEIKISLAKLEQKKIHDLFSNNLNDSSSLQNIGFIESINAPIEVQFMSSIPFRIAGNDIVPAVSISEDGQVAEINKSKIKLLSDIATEINKQTNIHYNPQDNSYLLPESSQFSNVPKYFKVKINQESGESAEILYVISQLDCGFSDWINGVILSHDELQKKLSISNTLEIQAVTKFKYHAYNLKNFLPVKSLDSNITYLSNMPIKPILGKYDAAPNKSSFKKVNINWNEIDPKNYFDAKVISIHDSKSLSVEKLENEEKANIRLSSIAALSEKVNMPLTSAFEYPFADISKKFMKELWSDKFNFKNNIRIAFIEKDSYNRIIADVFFGEDYQYSLNSEIVRAGLALPIAMAEINNEGTNIHDNKGTYEDIMCEKIALAMGEAIKHKRGFFHYFKSPTQVSKFIYSTQTNISRYIVFESIYKQLTKNEEEHNN
ncbi:hypothetical protein [Mycoplasma sp. BRA285]